MKLSLLLLVLLNLSAQAQDIWLEPDRYKAKVGESVRVRLMLGKEFSGDIQMFQPGGIETLQRISGIAGKPVDMLRGIQSPVKFITYSLSEAGPHIISLQAKVQTQSFSSAQFDAYLDDAALEDIQFARQKAGKSSDSVRVQTTFFMRLILQAGGPMNENPRKRLNQRIELVPVQNPLSLEPSATCTFRLLWDGKPAVHRMVRIWSKRGGLAFLQSAITGKDGQIEFPLSHDGAWLLEAEYMVPSQRPGVEYETFRTSFVFSSTGQP